MHKLRKGDQVVVSAGKDKGRQGKIERVFARKGKVLIAGINIYKRHLKKKDERNPGGIIDFPRPLPVNNVVLICPKCGQSTRVGFVKSGDEKRRICRKCEQVI